MPHFSIIQVQGFRRLKEVELPLGPLNVLVGPNGAGKTSLLDAFRLLSSSADGKLRECLAAWTGHHPKFHAHAALHDFEAWLLPYWDAIRKLAGSTRAAPAASPESINHDKPPARLLAEVFLQGSRGRACSKPRDAARILQGNDLTIAAHACPELKHFLNRIIGLCSGHPIP